MRQPQDVILCRFHPEAHNSTNINQLSAFSSAPRRPTYFYIFLGAVGSPYPTVAIYAET
jgi:hypothetical protein